MFGDQNENNICIIGHRGIKAYYPENTMLSFEKAIEYGLDGMETDIYMTTDHELVLHHDELLDRTTTGTGDIRKFSYSELRTLDAGIKFGEKFRGLCIPRFQELLDLVKNTELLLNVEIKDARKEVVDKTIKMLEQNGMTNRFVITSFDARVLRQAHREYGVKTQGFPIHMMKNKDEKSENDMFSVGIPMKELTPELCQEYREKSIEPWCWCPDTKEEVEKALHCKSWVMAVNNPLPALDVIRG